MKTEGQQLEMFLTTEQERAIQEYLNNHDFHFRNQKGDAEKKSQVLLENGFVEGVHFENTFTFKENVTETVSLGGRWYGVEEFEAELNVTKYQGGVYLLHDIVDGEDGTNKIIKKSTLFTLTSSGKIECYSIVGSYRSLKPATMLAKIAKLNESAKDRLVIVNQKDNHFDNAIEKLEFEFPTATSVEKRDEWISNGNYRNSYSKEVIVVKFTNDSSIMFELDYKGEKRIFRVYDVEEAKMTNEQKVERLVKRVG
jgi:hypothetical protein